MLPDSISFGLSLSFREYLLAARQNFQSLLPTLALGLFVPGISAGQVSPDIAPPSILAAAAGSTSPSVFDAHPGPWGQLQCAYVYLEAPASLIEEFPLPSPTPRWTFPAAALPSLPALFAKAGLSQSLVDKILTSKQLVKDGAFVHLLPPLAELESMTPETRAVIYS